jgi:hypothetical protein
VSLVRWRRSKVVVVIPRRMWRMSVTLPLRGRSLSSWRIRLLLLRPTTSMVERPTRTRTRRRRPLMRRRTVPKSIRMWRMRVEILRRMRVVVIIIRWVLLLLLLWWHRRWRVTLHRGPRGPTWSGSSSWTTWTTTSPVHVMMIGVPRRWRAGLVRRTSAPVVKVGVTRWWVLGESRRIIRVLGWHRRSDRDRCMMASALVKFVRGFVRGHPLKKKKKKGKFRRVIEHPKAEDTHVFGSAGSGSLQK